MESEDNSDIKLEQKAAVIKRYRSAYREPLKVNTGEVMTIDDRESEFSGWIWCSDSAGKSGWVPENYVEQLGPSARMLRDYEAIELDVSVGDELTILEEESGWVWCQTSDGRRGWVPATVIKKV